MKKLFTLLMILAVATVGYAQVKALRPTTKPQAMKAQQVSRVESYQALQNVQTETTMTRVEGNELDQTWYDWQSNDGARTWTHVWDNGKVDFAFTIATVDGYADRGTGLVTYDSNTGEWSGLGGRIENEKTGFGSIAQYGENGMVVAAHTATDCRVYVIEDRDALTAPNTVPVTSVLDGTYDPCWPNVMTSGPNRDIIHVIVTANGGNVPGFDGATTPLVYFRSTDGGQTWDKENVILPFLTSEYGVYFGSNCAYWMETTENNRLSLVLNSAWSDGMVIYSDDDGETWNRKVFYSHPNIHGVDTSEWFFYPRWTSAIWAGDQIKLAYEWNGSTGDAGSGTYYPGIGGVAFWGENLVYPEYGAGHSAIEGNLVPGEHFVMDTSYLYEDLYASMWWWSDANHEMLPEYMGYLTTLDADGNVEPYWEATEMNFVVGDGTNLGNHGHYNQGICAFPVLLRVPGSDDLVAVWSAMDENCVDGTGNFYYHLFANYSPDGGLTWGGDTWDNMVALCGGDDYWMYENSEMVYPQAAIIGDELIVVAQVDEGTGTYVQSDDTRGDDNFYVGYTFSLRDLFGESVSVPEVSHNTKMVVSPNPASTTLNVNLNQNSEIVIYTITGQAVERVKGHVGANSINISSLSSGIYFISAGSDTQKFVVK